MKDTIKTIERLSASDKLRYKLEAEEDAKRIYKSEIYDARQEGEALGIQAGRTQGIEEGRILGIEEGEALGIEKGKTLGIEEGKSLGKAEGSFNTKRTIVNFMKNNGADIQTISKSTGINIEEVESLLNI